MTDQHGLTFHLDAKKKAAAEKWISEHACELRGRYSGAIGGRTSFVFVATSVGFLEKVRCACGGEILLNGDEL